MLLDKETIQKILDIIKKRHNLFAYKIGLKNQLTDDEIRELKDEYGEEALNQLSDFMKDAYFAGFLRTKDFKTSPHNNVPHETFSHTPKPIRNELQKYSEEHSKEVLNGYIQGLSSQAKTAVNQLIQSYNNAYKNQVMTNVGVPMAVLNEKANRSVNELATAMKDVSGQLSRDWQRVARTETTNAVNIGMTDRIVKQNAGKSADQILVFKRVVNDIALCKHCKRLHLMPDGVTPRVYTLSEVLGNGTNVGRKADNWEMVINAVHPNCFDKETEVLTNEGWKFFKDVRGDETILSVDLDSQNAEWVKIKHKVQYKYNGQMHYYKSRITDLLVTPNHNSVVKTKNGKDKGKWKLQEESTLPKNHYSMLTTIPNWIGKNKKEITIAGKTIPIKNYVQFMAIYLSDGSITKSDKPYWELKITQKTDKKEIIDAAKGWNFEKQWIADDYVMYLIREEEMAQYFKKLGHSKNKFIPFELKELDKISIEMFLSVYSRYDGYLRKPKSFKNGNFSNEIKYFTISDQLAADLGELILKCGRRPSYKKQIGKEIKHHNGVYKSKDCWIINNGTTKAVEVGTNMERQLINYNDVVYDVELEKHHTLFVRRNGKVILSGNCRCTLIYIPEGYWFSPTGEMVFVGTDQAKYLYETQQ